MLLISSACYAVMYSPSHIDKPRRFSQWIFLQLIVLLLYVPWLIRARSINVGHTAIPTFEDIVSTLFLLIAGFGKPYPEWFQWLVVFSTAVMLCVLLAYNKKSRSMITSFIVVPIVSCIIISYFIRPIWLYRTLIYIVPFLFLAIALAILQLCASASAKSGDSRFSLDSVCLVTVSFVLSLMLVQQFKTFSRSPGFREAAKFVQMEARAGDVVYIPSHRVYWGWGWYFIGPGSINPLTTSYHIVTEGNIKMLSEDSIIEDYLKVGQTVWIIYNSKTTSLKPFESISPDLTKNFALNLKVIRLSYGISNHINN